MEKRRKSVAGVLIFIAFFVYFSFIAVDQQKMMNLKQSALDNAENRIRKEELIKQELEKQKEILNSDEYIEKVAREKLGLVKPGEKVFIDIEN